MVRLRPPFALFGSKYKIAPDIIGLMPPCLTYVDVFGGTGIVLMTRVPAPMEVFNDIDSSITDFFRVLQSPADAAELYRLLELTPYSREEYITFRDHKPTPEDSLVERVYRWYVVACTSFSGNYGCAIQTSVTLSRRGRAASVSRWNSIIKMLPDIAKRMEDVVVENMDFHEVIQKYDCPHTLFYCDPPYVAESRSTHSRNVYSHEMSDFAHEELVNVLCSIRGRAVVSGYDSEIYQRLEKEGWARHSFRAMCHSAGKTPANQLIGEGVMGEKHTRTEVVWVSPER